MTLLRRLLSPEYWVVAEPGPLGALSSVYAVLGLAFLAGLAAALHRLAARPPRRLTASPGTGLTSGAPQAYALFEACVTLAGLLAVVGRILDWPGWSARIWPFSLALLALAGAVAYRLRGRSLPSWLGDSARILALVPPKDRPEEAGCAGGAIVLPAADDAHRSAAPSLSLALGVCLHLLGISFVLRARYGWPIWLSPLALIVLMAPQLGLALRGRRPSLRALTPMLAVYLATLLWAVYHSLGITVREWQGLAFPDPMTSLFYVDGFLLAGSVYSWLCQIALVVPSFSSPLAGARRLLRVRSWAPWRWVAVVLILAASAWAAVVYLGKHTHGATGSDPYAYAQMAVDLATRGTLLHRFALFESVPQDIAWGPLLPDGYHLPRGELGESPSVWATGFSVLLAGGYRLLGEAGLYVTTPVLALLALAVTWALVQEALRGEPEAVRYLTGALAVALTATSPEQVDRVLVPMADAAAQLFTLVTLFVVLVAVRKLEENLGRAHFWLILGGFSFAWAYWVRHTQLVLCLPIAGVLLLAGYRNARVPTGIGTSDAGQGFVKAVRRGARSVWPLLLFSVSAMAMAIPDMLYRWRAFGSIFASETTELPSMALRNMGPVALQTARDAAAAGEWGYLLPLAAIGCYFLACRHRRVFALLGSAFAAVIVLHLTYRFLRLRDLISLFPLVNLAVSYGAVSLAAAARAHALRSRWPGRLGPLALCTGAVAWIVLSVALARWSMIDDLWKPGWASFGYMRPDQRAAFDRLAEIVPPQAVIGTSLNSGAVMLYTGRNAVRPYEGWSSDDWTAFVHVMSSASRPVYLLDDGGLMASFIQQRSGLSLIRVEALPIPLFGAQGRDQGTLYQVVNSR